VINTINIDATSGVSAGTAREVLVFTIDKEEYAVDIHKVQELRGYGAVTRIAAAPDYMKGVVNLRGIIVPILDMRIKFGVAVPAYNEFTVVVILSLGASVVGIVVDSVSDVATLLPDQIKPPPDVGAGARDYLLGLASVEERLLILVDIEKMIASDDAGDYLPLAA
jgi:purine-binding chemotaxis protein CheW